MEWTDLVVVSTKVKQGDIDDTRFFKMDYILPVVCRKYSLVLVSKNIVTVRKYSRVYIMQLLWV